MDLSPKQIHYLKREMLAIQLHKELETVRRKPELLARLDEHHSETLHLPFLRYVFQNIVVEFPLLKKGGKQQEFWEKCHEFLNEFGKVQLETFAPSQANVNQRQAMTRKLEKTLLLALNVGIKTVQGQEESIKVTPTDLDASLKPIDDEEQKPQKFIFTDVNIATVRQVREPRTLFGPAIHAEFIITLVYNDERISVARRHGQFRQLYDQLKGRFPRVSVPMVPAKSSRDAGDFYRDKDRLLLRAFLRRVIAHPKLVNCPDVHEFLTQNPVSLTPEEIEDTERRWEMDLKRAEQEQKFRQEVDEKVVALNDLLDMLKKQLMQPGGLVQVMNTIKNTEQLVDLPDTLRKAFEWGRINFAFTLHTHFVTEDTAAENTATLKRTHSFMPYRTMATILKFSNPISIVKAVLDLFLAQPLGGRSLFQRVILANMEDDAKTINRDIQTLEESIGDELLCAKVANAVYTTVPIGYTGPGLDRANTNPIVETLVLLQREDIEPQLSSEQIVKLAHMENGHNKNNRRMLKQIYDLWLLRARKREQELLMTLVFQGVTGEILKELFALFYQPLAQVYKAANIGESIHHLSAFLSDLIQLLDSLESATIETNTVEPFVLLVQRHEQKFYQFVHRVHAQDTSHLFDELVGYVDHILGSLTRGIYPDRLLDLHDVVTLAGIQSDQYQELRDEIDALCEHRKQQKLLHLERTRKKVQVHKNTMEESMEKNAREDYQDLIQFLPSNLDIMGIINDIEEIESEDTSGAGLTEDVASESEDEEEEVKDSRQSVSSSQLEPPVLELIPAVVPYFVKEVALLMESALQSNRKLRQERQQT